MQVNNDVISLLDFVYQCKEAAQLRVHPVYTCQRDLILLQSAKLFVLAQHLERLEVGSQASPSLFVGSSVFSCVFPALFFLLVSYLSLLPMFLLSLWFVLQFLALNDVLFLFCFFVSSLIIKAHFLFHIIFFFCLFFFFLLLIHNMSSTYWSGCSPSRINFAS